MTEIVRRSAVTPYFGAGGAGLAPDGGPGSLQAILLTLLASLSAPYADAAALAASVAVDREDGMLAVRLDNNSLWIWRAEDATAADSSHIAPDDVGSDPGRWVDILGGASGGLLSALDQTKLNSIQTGTVTLTTGAVTKNTGITMTAGSKVFLQLETPGGTTGVAHKVSGKTAGAPGVGAFTVTAVDTSGALVNTDTSTLAYLIVG